jgi:hypothetical protein
MVKKLVDPQYHKVPRPMMKGQPFLSSFATLTMCIGPLLGIVSISQRWEAKCALHQHLYQLHLCKGGEEVGWNSKSEKVYAYDGSSALPLQVCNTDHVHWGIFCLCNFHSKMRGTWPKTAPSPYTTPTPKGMSQHVPTMGGRPQTMRPHHLDTIWGHCTTFQLSITTQGCCMQTDLCSLY